MVELATVRALIHTHTERERLKKDCFLENLFISKRRIPDYLSPATFNGECKDNQNALCNRIRQTVNFDPHSNIYSLCSKNATLRTCNFVVLNYNCLQFLDVDECAGSHGCGQLCKNLPGGFECQCQQGYRLEADQKTCVGKKLPFFALEYF